MSFQCRYNQNIGKLEIKKCFGRAKDDSDCRNTLPVEFMFVDDPASMTKKKHGCSVVRHLAVNSAQTGARGRLELTMRYEQSSLLKASW